MKSNAICGNVDRIPVRCGVAPGHTGPRDASPAPTEVVFLPCADTRASAPDHDLRTKAAVARAIADLLGCRYGGTADRWATRQERCGATPYVVPSHTLLADEARDLRISAIDRFFGGIVPEPHVATKLISHPLVSREAARPTGWSDRYGDMVRAAVLPGYSAFSQTDALTAGERLLDLGRIRIKEPDGVGGSGQHVVGDHRGLRECLKTIGADRISREGLVLEVHVDDVRTHSVGQLQVGQHRAAYLGTQRLTRNGRGEPVYGGSSLQVVRGGLEALHELALSAEQMRVVTQARIYDAAADVCFRNFVASRRNYDVASGTVNGRTVSGVLEQSWRIGGASGAEVAALHRLRERPALGSVRSATHEVYGNAVVPQGAWISYSGVDAHGHPLTKYVEVQE